MSLDKKERGGNIELPLLRGVDAAPVIFHADDVPFAGLCFIQAAVEFANVGVAVVGPFAFFVIVMHEQTEAGTFTRGGVFEHLEVAVGIAGGKDRTTAGHL